MVIQEQFDIKNYLDKSKFQAEELTYFLSTNNVGLLIVLDFVKAKDWPYYGKTLRNDPIKNIPLIWALFYSEDGKSVKVTFEIHPTKCFPNLYKKSNRNYLKFPTPIVTESDGTLGGCLRNSVNINGRRYAVKAPEYCSIFGVPDDCYDLPFEERMLKFLISKANLNIWCYETTEYIKNNIDPYIKIKYMKGEFLPSKYFMYVDAPTKFLKGIFKHKDIIPLNQDFWYLNGKEFIDERNLDDTERDFRFEEKSINIIKNRLKFEFLRQLVLLMNKDQFKNYIPTNYPQLNLKNKNLIEQDIRNIIQPIVYEVKLELENILKNLGENVNKSRFNSSRLLVLDVEYAHVTFPTGSEERSFNFPCMFSSILWEGPREGLKININPLILPCHLCVDSCDNFKKSNLKFDCLVFAHQFIDNQISLIEEMFARHDNFKIYSYGKSDILQLEQSDNFFIDSFETRAYLRRNRKRAKTIANISSDISEPSKSLEDIEHEHLEKWLDGWSRKYMHQNVNRRFMTRWGSQNWKTNYHEAIRISISDTSSAFLYLIYKNYRIDHEKVKLKSAMSLNKFL